jgi:hypothetical protein
MITPPYPSSVITKKITLADDNIHNISDSDLFFYSCDFQAQTNAIKIGAAGIIETVINAGETYWTYNANLREFSFKNETAGSNGVLVILATVPNPEVEEALKGGWKLSP